MKKYLFIFDLDQKVITYLPKYNDDKENNLDNDNNGNSYLKIINLEILLVVFYW